MGNRARYTIPGLNGINYVFIWESSCWHCKQPILLMHNQYGMGDYFSGTDGNLPPDILLDLANRYDLRYENRESKTMESHYYKNVCKNCDTPTGDHYVSKEFLQMGYDKTEEIYERSCVYDDSLDDPSREVDPDNFFNIKEMRG